MTEPVVHTWLRIIPINYFALSLFFSCEVRSEGSAKMGSCFLPPYETSCSGLPSGCGSCVSQCSNGQSSSSSAGATSLTIINNDDLIFDWV